MIIGLCGTSLLGREEIATLLIDKDFGYYSIGNEIDEAIGRKKSPAEIKKFDERTLKRKGRACWAKQILSRISEENAVVDGVRLVDEVKEFRKRKDFVLVGVYSPIEVRLDRAAAKEMSTKKKTIEDAYAHALEELSEVFKMIDYSVVYPSGPVVLKRKVDEIIKKMH